MFSFRGAGEKKYKCTTCERSFEYAKNLANHAKTHQDGDSCAPGVFKCKHCDATYRTYAARYYHMKQHFTTFQCTICPRTFKSGKGLKYHMNRHNGVADFLCDDCGKGFITRQKMMIHRRAKHTFEKPYICDACGEGFTRSDWLVVHRRRAHTGERPYKCDVCEWRGVDSSSLIHHRKRHKGVPAVRRQPLPPGPPLPLLQAPCQENEVAASTQPTRNTAA